MKSIRNIAFSALMAIGAFTMVTYTACNTDECKDVVCNNGGTCQSGLCDCLPGYEGTSCDVISATKTIGTYSATEDCQPPVTATTWSSSITASSTDETKIVITNFGDSGDNVTGTVDQNAITLDASSVSGNTVTGTGTINGNVITISYTLDGTVTDYNCTMTMTKQ